MFIKKDGFYDIDDDGLEFEILEKRILHHLKEQVEIKEAVTLRDLLIIINRSPSFSDFLSSVCWIDMDVYLKYIHYNKPPDEKFECIEQITYISLFEDRVFNGKDYMEYAPSFSAVKVLEDGSEENYSISCQFTNLLDVPFKLSGTASIYDEKRNKDGSEKLEYRYNICLYEFLFEFFWDLGFYGTPEKSEKMIEGLEEMRDDVIDGDEEYEGVDFGIIMKQIDDAHRATDRLRTRIIIEGNGFDNFDEVCDFVNSDEEFFKSDGCHQDTEFWELIKDNWLKLELDLIKKKIFPREKEVDADKQMEIIANLKKCLG